MVDPLIGFMAPVCSQEELARGRIGGRAIFSVQAVPVLTHRICHMTSRTTAAGVQLVLRRMSSGGTQRYLEIIGFFHNFYKFVCLFVLGATAPSGPGPPHSRGF